MNKPIVEGITWAILAVLAFSALLIAHFPLIFLLLFLSIFTYALMDFYRSAQSMASEQKSTLMAISDERMLMMLILIFLIGVLLVNFPFMLTVYALASGFILLLDNLVFKKRRHDEGRQESALLNIAREYFWVLFLVWTVRSFVVQPYRVPTSSLAPTVLPGDFIIVNQFAYGLRFPAYPFVTAKFISVGQPERGDIVLFRNPLEPDVLYVKRLVGLPGDDIVYYNKQLKINGKLADQVAVAPQVRSGLDENEEDADKLYKLEKLGPVEHAIYLDPSIMHLHDNGHWTVPAGHYFMMGDNRDHSYDSRYWGVVPEENLVGKVMGYWLSWDASKETGWKVWQHIRWNRVGFGVLH